MNSRVKGIVYQNLLMGFRNQHAVQELFLWPSVDLIIWGVTSMFISQITGGNQNIILALLGGTIFWTVVWRAQQDISLVVMRDIWDKNLINIFTTPITKWEFALGLVILSFIKTFIIVGWMAGLSFILYHFNFIQLGFWWLIFIFLLIMFGWSAGFIISGLILRFGTKVENLNWSFLAILQPLVGVFYSISILPGWIQHISWIFPPTYIFENIRSQLILKFVNINDLVIALFLSFLWLAISIIYYSRQFETARVTGNLSKSE